MEDDDLMRADLVAKVVCCNICEQGILPRTDFGDRLFDRSEWFIHFTGRFSICTPIRSELQRFCLAHAYVLGTPVLATAGPLIKRNLQPHHQQGHL